LNYSQARGAIILAGGDSKRLGKPKPLLELGGKTLIRRAVERLSPFFSEITVITDRRDYLDGLPVGHVRDLLADPPKSPLKGIHAGLSVSSLPYQFVAACDMPFFCLPLIEYMAGFAAAYDAVVPRIGDHYQPLHAFYRRSCLEVIRQQLAEEKLKVTGFYSRLRVRYVGLAEITRFDPGQESFFNINTWADYDTAVRLLAEREPV
jgi:molybdenum cofactor guanylyltransferase